jgi:hypothetical protein
LDIAGFHRKYALHFAELQFGIYRCPCPERIAVNFSDEGFGEGSGFDVEAVAGL